MSGLLGKKRPPSVRVMETADKGRGIFLEEPVANREYVLEYKGDVYPRKEKRDHEQEYATNDEGCFILEVQTKEGWVCIDPTRRPSSAGRLINHAPSTEATLIPFRPLKVFGKWRVGFTAARDLSPGEELTFDYGSAPGGIDWLKKRPMVKTTTTARKP